jgi:hypothetical protein
MTLDKKIRNKYLDTLYPYDLQIQRLAFYHDPHGDYNKLCVWIVIEEDNELEDMLFIIEAQTNALLKEDRHVDTIVINNEYIPLPDHYIEYDI